MGGIGRAVLGAYQKWCNIRDGAFSRLCGGGFATFGRRSRLSLPVNLHRPDRIHIGAGVYFGPGCWLQALVEDGDPDAEVRIGDRCSFAGGDVLSAAKSITVEPGVLFARNVYVSDHMHAIDDPRRPIQDQGITKVRPVVIEEGAWLGQNVVVCPGVRIGRGAVVGAGSVVRADVAARTVVAGSPARLIRELQA